MSRRPGQAGNRKSDARPAPSRLRAVTGFGSIGASMKFFLFVLLLPTMLAAQSMELTQQLEKTVLYGDIALSPDGTRVAWTQASVAQPKPRLTFWVSVSDRSALVAVETGGTDQERSDADLAWSPDSKRLAFFSTSGEKNEQPQLWLTNDDGTRPEKLRRMDGYAARPHWSHDGKRIAFLYIEGAGGGGPLLAAPGRTGVIDHAIHNQRIAVLDLDTKQVRQVSPPDLHVYDFDWSPDDQKFVATAAPGPGDNNWWIAQIYAVDLAGEKATSIYKPSLQVAVPRWSPDGKSIAFIEGIMSDEGIHGGDLFTVSASGQSPINRTKSRKSSVNSFFWLNQNEITLLEYVGGETALARLTVADGAIRTVWRGAEGLHAFGNFPDFSLAADGRIAAAVRSDYTTPPEIWAGPVDHWQQLTHGNSGLFPSWGKAESLQWTNDNYTMQGWIVLPAKSEADARHPMVVLIHGGPSSVSTPEWPGGLGMSRAIVPALSARGYYVFLPNPRGSYGQGEDFTRANVKDLGGGDLRDLMTGIDAAARKYPIDPARLGVTGWSYGGFMTMWTVTQTDRFRAAVAGAGIANWQSYYGQNLIDQWMIPFFGASVYDDPGVYQKSSPIHSIKNVKTPTLVIVGERDAECPPPQSYEFWHALKTLKVPTQLIVYPGEGHMFLKPENQKERLEQTLEWFDRYLK